MSLSNNEKGILAHARRTKNWISQNSWIKFPIISLAIGLGWFAPLFGAVLFIAAAAYILILWSIIKKA